LYQRTGDIVIAHGGARQVVSRWIGNRLHRQQAGAGIVGKGDSEPRAVGWLDKR
jgi:hypothetical protein